MTNEARRKTILQVNRKLKNIGQRICPTCEQLYPLTDRYWRSFVRRTGKLAGTRWQASDCRECEKAARAKANRELWASNPKWKQRKQAQNQAWNDAHREHINEQARTYKQGQRRQAFRVLLGG